jgi:hypothetical protein
VDFDLSVVPQNRWSEVSVGHASRSSGLLHVEVGAILKLPDQKARGFLVLIALSRWFSKHGRKVFDEMCEDLSYLLIHFWAS